MPFSGFIEYITNEKRYSGHTIRAYSDDLTAFSTYCISSYEIKNPAEASHQVIRSWLASMVDQGISPRTVKRKLSSLNSWFTWLLRMGELKYNPVRKVVAPKTSKRLPVFVEESRMDFLLEDVTFSNDYFGQRDRLILEIFYATGMRLSELTGVRVNDISSTSIKVLGKRNKERIIPIAPALFRLIENYMVQRDLIISQKGQDPGYLLLTDEGKKLYPVFVYRKVNYYLTLVTTINKRSPHVLRHTFATHMLNKGADLNAIKELLGHSSLAATQVYTHNTIEKLKNIYSNAHPLAG
jgi:integrase/recombinase XerC